MKVYQYKVNITTGQITRTELNYVVDRRGSKLTLKFKQYNKWKTILATNLDRYMRNILYTLEEDYSYAYNIIRSYYQSKIVSTRSEYKKYLERFVAIERTNIGE